LLIVAGIEMHRVNRGLAVIEPECRVITGRWLVRRLCRVIVGFECGVGHFAGDEAADKDRLSGFGKAERVDKCIPMIFAS